MKWNSDRSLQLSLWCTRLAMVLVVVSGAASGSIVTWYLRVSGKTMELHLPITAALLLCCIPAMGALLWLHKLLSNINDSRVFVDENVTLLRRISWCCFLAAGITLVASRFYLVFLLISVAAAFMGLILRVVKNVIQQAVILRTENELTI